MPGIATSLPGLAVTLPSLADAAVLILGGADASKALCGYGNVVSGAGGRVILTGRASLSAISLGDGADRVSLHGALNTIVLGNGDVAVHATGGGACVRIGPGDVRVDYGRAVHVTLALAVPGFGNPACTGSGFVDSGRSFGWFEGGHGNIGILNGMGNAAASDGISNIGVLNGNGNGSAGNGSSNIGVLDGNFNGRGDRGPGNGVGNGRFNVGALDGNMDGNGNIGARSGSGNGRDNLGAANGNFDGNLNHGHGHDNGHDKGNDNGQGNVGNLNGNFDGNGAILASPQPQPLAHGGGLTLTGALDTVVVGDGNDTIRVEGGLSTIVSGNGRDRIHIGGSYDTVVAGNGRDVVTGCVDHAAIRLGDGDDSVTLSGAGGNVVLTGAGDDVIRLSGWGNLVDAGASRHHDTIYGGRGDDTFVVTAAGHGFDRIYDFSAWDSDVLDLRGALAAAGWHGSAGGIAAELHVASGGGNTWVGIGAGAGAMVAELVGVAASLQTLLAGHALRIA